MTNFFDFRKYDTGNYYSIYLDHTREMDDLLDLFSETVRAMAVNLAEAGEDDKAIGFLKLHKAIVEAVCEAREAE